MSAKKNKLKNKTYKEKRIPNQEYLDNLFKDLRNKVFNFYPLEIHLKINK